MTFLKMFHIFYQVDDLINGHIQDFEGKKRLFYEANSGLTSHDVLAIANDAFRSNYLQGYVEWLKGASKKAKAEKRPGKELLKIRFVLHRGAVFACPKLYLCFVSEN